MAIVITDVKGGRLRLSKNRLTELTGESVRGSKWYLELKMLRSSIAMYKQEGGVAPVLIRRTGHAHQYPLQPSIARAVGACALVFCITRS